MINIFVKKITPAILIISIFSSGYFFFPVKKAGAQMAVAEAGASLWQQIVNTANSVVTSGSTYSLNLKEYVLDPLASGLAKQVIRQLTGSIVNWINSGFDGSPAFLQNPGAFFLDVADQITGDFLAKHGGPLTDLCSPFSIDIRLALSFKYHPNVQQRYRCTLGTIINNSKSAIEGASINGFTAGDFKQGGWPAFVSLTTEPQNNVYGAYLIAENELSLRVANAEATKKDEISAGRGFLSWRDPKCKDEVNTHNAQVAKNFEDLENASGAEYREVSDRIARETTAQNLDQLYNGATGETSSQTSSRIGGDVSQMTRRSVQDCPVLTPGSFIVDSLSNTADGPLQELRLADEINEIVNALFAQLTIQILQKGLGAVSGSGPGDSTSYISQIQNEAAAINNTTNVNEMRASILAGMETPLQNTIQFKGYKDRSLDVITTAKRDYDGVKACYQAHISSGNLDGRETSDAQDRINEIDNLVSIKVAPLAAKQLTAAMEADARLKTLNDLKTSVTTAKTINDLNTPSQQFSLLAQQQRLTNAKDVVDAQQEYESVSALANAMREEARLLQNACELFPDVIRR